MQTCGRYSDVLRSPLFLTWAPSGFYHRIMAGDRPEIGGPTGASAGDPPWASTRAGVSLPIAVPKPIGTSAAVKVRPAVRKRPWLSLLCLGLLVSLGSWCFYEYATLPNARSLIDRNPETTALIQARDTTARSEGKAPRHRQYWVPLTSIAPRTVDSVIA